MHRLGKLVLSFGAVALLSTSAYAQRPGGGGFGPGGGGGGALMLLQNKSVAQELKLNDSQEAKIKEAADKSRERLRDAFQSAGDLGASERAEKMADLQKTAREESKKVVADVLKPEQAERLAQIERQQNTLQALADPDVQGLLKLTASQKDKIAKINDDLQKEQRDAFGAGGRGGDPAERRERMEKLQTTRKDATDKAVALLTDEQKSTWKDLVGAPFELKRENNGGGRGGRGRGN